jgi:hypothetical protein
MGRMSKQIIYLINSPLSDRDFDRYGIQKWINCGWSVKAFDITKILRPEFSISVSSPKTSVDFELTQFDSINEILLALKSLENKAVFVDIIDFGSIESKIRAAAFREGVLIRLRYGTIPVLKSEINAKKILKLFKQPYITILKIIEKIRVRRYVPNYWVVGGSESMAGINGEKSLIILAHNRDYDSFIQEGVDNLNQVGNYILFLDQYGPYHSDFIHCNITPFVTADNYYHVIDSGLSRMAGSWGLDVKVAAHPRSAYETKQIKYEHPIFRGNTFKLIRGARVVVAHDSTSLQWAIIMKKPLIFVTTDEIQNTATSSWYADSIHSFATSLGKNVVNLNQISKIHDWSPYLDIDEEKYEKYIYSYITQVEKPKKMYWDVVIERIESDFFSKTK